jgi:phage/plasmid-like protein (TIGR03299 family)
MAHDLTIDENGKVSMAYLVGTPRWHGLGNEVEPGEPVEVWAKAAGLDYRLAQAKVLFLPEGSDSLRAMDSREVIYRLDTLDGLSVMGNRYKVHQPEDMLGGFKRVCDELGFTMETAGDLQGGKRLWVAAYTGNETSIGGLPHRQRALLAGSCDGSLASTLKSTLNCTVCNNTMTWNLNGAGLAVRQFHSGEFNIDAMIQAAVAMDWQDLAEAYENRMRELAKVPVGLENAETFFASLLSKKSPERLAAEKELAEKAGETVKKIRGLDSIMESYNFAPGAAPGTALGLVQAATHYVDHVRGKDNDTRITSALFGQGETLKTRAFEAAQELVAA